MLVLRLLRHLDIRRPAFVLVGPGLSSGSSGPRVDAVLFFFFFFNDTAPPEIYPLSLPAALPISSMLAGCSSGTASSPAGERSPIVKGRCRDRKSTRLNSSHVSESRMPSSAG